MNIENKTIIITSILSIISLVISLKTYLLNKPKMKIKLANKDADAYFGTVFLKSNKTASTYIGFVKLNIINNSPVEISIDDVKLKIGGSYHSLVNKNDLYWDDCYFYYLDDSGDKNWDGCGLNYKENGISLPVRIRPYTILSGECLFYHFPFTYSNSKICKIILYTAVGRVTKYIKFKRYNEFHTSSEIKDIELYLKNQIKTIK